MSHAAPGTTAGPARAPVAASVAASPAAPPADAPRNRRLGPAGLASYGALRAPLALLELPLFVLLPSLYGDRLGVDLAWVGAILFATRLVDAVADPAIGSLIDRHGGGTGQRRWILAGLPVLAIGYGALLAPPTGVSLPAWLAIASMVTYLAYSVVSIAHQAWGAALGSDARQRVRVTATREAFGLAGVLVSASLLVPDRAGLLALLFAASAAVAALALARAPLPGDAMPTPESPATPTATPTAAASAAASAAATATAAAGPPPPLPRATRAWREAVANPAFRWLLAAFVVNGIATAIPATLVLFFVGDVLGAPDRAPLFLVAYFVAGAIGMPAWVRLSRRVGLRGAWLLGMALSVLAFVWTLGLGHGDTTAFLVVCMLTGFALGADLAVPPALLATMLARDDPQRRRTGTYFGLWNLATKLNLAAAAGIALPALSWLGYRPGATATAAGLLALTLAYAALPSLLKLAAGAVLMAAPLPPEATRAETAR